MTAVQPPAPNEPPPPQRGLTREERGRDISAAQAEVEAETSTVKRYLKAMSPRFLWPMGRPRRLNGRRDERRVVDDGRRPIIVVNAA